MNIVTNLWSTSFVVGLVSGFLLSRLWCAAKTWWLNKHDPLPNGRHRSIWAAVAVDRRWFIGMIAVSFLVWSVVTTSQNASDNERNAAEARRFAAEVQACQAELIDAIKGSRRVSAENERLDRQQVALFADLESAGSTWIDQILNLPPEIASLPRTDPRVEAWGQAVTRIYSERKEDLSKQIRASIAEQARLESTRPPLPDPSCGK